VEANAANARRLGRALHQVVSFSRAWAGRRRLKFDKRLVGFLGEAELIRNKRLAGRPEDLLDLELLKETRPARMNRRLR